LEEKAESAAKRQPERRAQSRHKVDARAAIYLVNTGTVLRGRILDLSLGGCRIRADERFPVGIFRRVETEFRFEGLPFRLGGVTQAIHDRQTVGIRFLDVSDRKREQLLQLIEEIEELRQREESKAAPAVPPLQDSADKSATPGA
jgi:c-di-GMP-binding flagellar brake protein YcgR